MLYLGERELCELGIEWKNTIEVICQTIYVIDKNDFAQPVKPYLRYGDRRNRIISMPAFVGGEFHIAGIKWIVSFPGNIGRNLPRAHSVVVLNDADTGVPVCIINTAKLSVIRTASVSGSVISHYQRSRKRDRLNIGILGWGPIGQHHFQMCASLLGHAISKICIYDLRPIDTPFAGSLDPGQVIIAKSWQEAYDQADIFITCTVADDRYIDRPPKAGSLHLNVSLRDYTTGVYPFFEEAIIVDDWEEVCRENTDIEKMALEKGLKADDTWSIADVVVRDCIEYIPSEQPIMFNPMGMAAFDIALGKYYLSRAKASGIGVSLP
jgi:N-[(2S)-2-amino-2-carboxyethyl]-L-glutamate dehydrogenase